MNALDARARALALAQAAPADYLDIHLESRKSASLSFSGKELEEIGEHESGGGSVRACHQGGWGFCSFNLFKDLARATDEAISQARSVGKGKTELKNTPPIKARAGYESGENPAPDGLEGKKALCESYNKILLSHSRIASSRVTYLDRAVEQFFVSSEGSEIEQRRVFTGLSFSATARDGANVQRAYDSVGDHRGYGNVTHLEPKVEEVARRAVELLSAPKITGGRFTVVIDPKLAGVFAHEAFGHLSEADFIYDNPSIREKMKVGGVFGTETLNIVDDGTRLEECGGYAFDDEGVPSQKTYLVKNGRLSGHLHSRETSEKMGEPLTGNARAIHFRYQPIVRMSCTYIEPGNASQEELLDGIGDGVYAAGMLGGNTDLAQFTFSAEYAYRIRNGKLAGLLRDVILSGNVFETLHHIDLLGKDFKLFGGMGGCGKGGQSPLPVSDGGPSLRIQNLLVG